MKLLLASVFFLAQSFGQDWSKLDFLFGKWTGAASEKETPKGASQGSFSFEPDLDKKIVVRKNHADLGKGETHDDLMVIYLDGSTRAIYFDSEGHTIRYNVAFPEKDRVVFESDGTQRGPRYRLSYWMEKAGLLKGRFEVAPTPQADFKTYLSWGAVKSR